MRTRHANPFANYHGACRCIDLVVGPDADPHEIAVRAEAAVPGLRLFHRGDREVNGCVYTSLRPSGHRYVCICLYDHECTNPACACGSGPVNQRPAPALTEAQCLAMCQAAGESRPADLLDGPSVHLTEETAPRVLAALGFTDRDAPCRDNPLLSHAPMVEPEPGQTPAAEPADPIDAMGLDEVKETLRDLARVAIRLLKKIEATEGP